MRRNYRKTLSVLLAVGSAVGITVSLTAALGGFNAAITNPTNTFSSGTIFLKEVANATTCYSTASGTVISSNANSGCATNLFADPGNNAPGSTAVSSSVVLSNIGTIAASSFTMTISACTAAANSATSPYSGSDTAGYCGKVDVTVAQGTGATATCLIGTLAGTGGCQAPTSANTLATLVSHGAFSLGAMAALTGSTTLTITEQLDTSATNSDQGLTATVPVAFLLSQ
jgi:hypothetical protein